MKKKIAVMAFVAILILSVSSTAFAAENPSCGGDYILDQNNTLYVYQDGTYKVLKQDLSIMATSDSGFGEENAEWVTTETSNGYTVNHKGWKERQSELSNYGVRACSKTTCSPTKSHYTRARMTNLLGVTQTDSGRCWSTGTAYAASPYHDCHYTNAVMRSNWGGVED